MPRLFTPKIYLPRRSSRYSRGLTMLELGVVMGIIGVASAILAPNMLKAMRTYRLNGAAQQVADAFSTAKFTAVRANTTQSVFFNTTTNAIAVGQTTAATAIPLPAGITFVTTASAVGAPSLAATAITNAGSITGQPTDPHLSVSFPAVTGQTNFKQAGFTSRGLPNVTPGAVNWVYLTNTQNEMIAITITSAGSTRIWRWNASSSTWS